MSENNDFRVPLSGVRAGHVIRCKWPDSRTSYEPGQKRRPALILVDPAEGEFGPSGLTEQELLVQVAFIRELGRGRNGNNLGAFEILLDSTSADNAGLPKDPPSVIDMTQVRWLPLNHRFFQRNDDGTVTTGKISLHTVSQALALLRSEEP